VLNLAIGFGVSGIAWQAHIGGLIAGSALTAAYAYAPRQNRTLIQLAATAGIIALIIAGVIVRDYQIVGAVRLWGAVSAISWLGRVRRSRRGSRPPGSRPRSSRSAKTAD
jgi:membrane associated rhomboid family serine protease